MPIQILLPIPLGTLARSKLKFKIHRQFQMLNDLDIYNFEFLTFWLDQKLFTLKCARVDQAFSDFRSVHHQCYVSQSKSL